jgi:general secretion pathway protein F
MVAAGEASGTLDSVLTNLASYLEGQVELRRKIVSSLTYPVLMLFLCSGVIVGLLIFVIPRIVEIFVKQGAVLPLPTRIVIAISDTLIAFWPAIAAVIVGTFFGVRWYYATERGRAVIDDLLLKVPISGALSLKIATARMTQTLSTLLKSGVGLLSALDIARNIVTNVHLRKAIEEARVGVQEGRSLARELGKSGRFPTLLSHMIAVGEKSGELEGMLERSGKAYENEVNASLAGLTSLLEPVMMILVGGVVLGIVISVLLPMADLISIIQQ